MTKAAFTTKPDSIYDDLPEDRYHFPKSYLRQAEATIGDWIVYYEPRRRSSNPSSHGGRQAYFATARVQRIEPDPRKKDHFYAFVTDYLEFDSPVPFRDGDHYYESSLKRNDGATSKGAFGRAVRPLPDIEHDLILRAGFAPVMRSSREENIPAMPGFAEPPATFERPLIESVMTRPFRDEAFRRNVRAAYDVTCAMTGLRIINGGGRPEVEAAHIRPVEDKGPDSVRNGVALSRTVHWLFDRGLLSIDDDYTILKARGRIPSPVQSLLTEPGKLIVPDRNEIRPHPVFLKYHREHVFKG